MSLVPCDRIFEEDNEEVMNKEQKRSNNKEFKGFKRAAENTAHISSLVFLLSLLIPFKFVRSKDVNFQYQEVRSNYYSFISRVPASGSAQKLQHGASNQTTYSMTIVKTLLNTYLAELYLPKINSQELKISFFKNSTQKMSNSSQTPSKMKVNI